MHREGFCDYHSERSFNSVYSVVRLLFLLRHNRNRWRMGGICGYNLGCRPHAENTRGGQARLQMEAP